MQKMALYKVVNRELVFVDWVSLPDTIRDYDAWLYRAGYDRSHTLRTGIVRETTKTEIAYFQRVTEKLKRSGKLPSAVETIANMLAGKH